MSETRVTSDRRIATLRTRWWHPDYAVLHPLLRELESALRTYAAGTLLDLGCGNAPYQPWYRDPVTQIVRADHPPVSRATDVGCSAEALPFRDASFDTILCTQVLEHVPRPWIVASEIARTLRPGGYLILSCPQYWPEHEKPHDFFRYTRFGLQALFPVSQWTWAHHATQGGSFAVISCALWQALHADRRWKRALIFFANPFLLTLDRLFGGSEDTTNHLVVLRRKNEPSA